MSRRPLTWRASEKLAALASRPKEEQGVEGDGKMTKNQLKKLEKQKRTEEQKAAKAREKEAAKAASAGGAAAADTTAAAPASS